MKEHVKKTFNENVLTDLGGFGGLFRAPGPGHAAPGSGNRGIRLS